MHPADERGLPARPTAIIAACTPITVPNTAVAVHSPITTARSGSALPNTSPNNTNESASCQYAPPSIINPAAAASTARTAANTTVARRPPASTGNRTGPAA